MYEYEASVVRVVDGDTVDLLIDLGLRVLTKARVRLLGINAPEHNTSAGQASLAYLATVLPAGTQVTVTTHKDKTEKYGRWLAQISVGSTDVNAQMVAQGFAVSWDGKGERP